MGSCFGTSNRRGHPSGELDGPDGSGKWRICSWIDLPVNSCSGQESTAIT